MSQNPLERYTDAQLTVMLETARLRAARGAHVLGPFSTHCIAVEQMRRRCHPDAKKSGG